MSYYNNRKRKYLVYTIAAIGVAGSFYTIRTANDIITYLDNKNYVSRTISALERIATEEEKQTIIMRKR